MKTTLIEALKEAGKIQLNKFQNIDEISIKENISSIVTTVDLECEARIINIIEDKFPEHSILSEEAGLESKGSGYTWVIDPLDGTSNYAVGLPWFGVLIALFKQNAPILAGAYLPVADKLYIAESEKGATVNDQSLKIKSSNIKDTLVAFSMDHSSEDNYLNKGIDVYKYLVQHSRNVRTTNCLVDLLNVAENSFGCCINMSNGIWDIAAPYLILQEAGGIVRYLNGEAMAFKLDDNNLNKNYPIIAGPKSIVDKVIEVI